eukprot:3719981-Pyramimonas_sp.AAC.1
MAWSEVLGACVIWSGDAATTVALTRVRSGASLSAPAATWRARRMMRLLPEGAKEIARSSRACLNSDMAA